MELWESRIVYLLIPNFHGGASQGELGTDSETYQAIKQSPQARTLIKQNTVTVLGNTTLYFRTCLCWSYCVFPICSGIVLIKGYMRWWVVITTILMLALGWGKNFMPLTEFFLDYFPGYNKFRAVSTTLVIVEFLLPLFGFVALHKLLEDSDKSENQKAIKWGVIITGGLCFLFALMPTMFFDFVGYQMSN